MYVYSVKTVLTAARRLNSDGVSLSPNVWNIFLNFCQEFSHNWIKTLLICIMNSNLIMFRFPDF